MQPGGPYPGLRGVMTWSVNWDAAASCASSYGFSETLGNYFNGSPIVSNRVNNDVKGFIVENKLTIQAKTALIKQVNVYNLLGQLIKQQNFDANTNTVEVFDDYFNNKQIFIIKVVDKEEIITELKIY